MNIYSNTKILVWISRYCITKAIYLFNVWMYKIGHYLKTIINIKCAKFLMIYQQNIKNYIVVNVGDE